MFYNKKFNKDIASDLFNTDTCCEYLKYKLKEIINETE